MSTAEVDAALAQEETRAAREAVITLAREMMSHFTTTPAHALHIAEKALKSFDHYRKTGEKS